ncbi:RHS repeat-associated core domain-containing protein [Catenulispora pinistramenti]|uniref:RHS repeat-associated core domain-containing protein n=1 Tax=Catenulispora pinistramenti TaxID=2705254 RepID=UPI0027DC3530|nr:RHS repeat-associated core domain-containing protein [Catenulispora pinistramenti]
MESVQALAKEFGDFAHDVESAYQGLNSFGRDTATLQWVGQTADAFKANFGSLPGRLQKLYTSYSEASDALSAYAPKLQAAQAKADAALRQAQDAQIDLQRATTNADTAADDLKGAQQTHAVNPNPHAVADAQTDHDIAQKNLSDAKNRMAALTAQAHQAYNDRITAAKDCAKAMHHAQSDGIHNKHWWQHLGADLSEWGGKIAEVANEIAPVLDVLALATSWIPGVDVVTAGLAEADNLVALASTGLQISGDAMQGHFGDALMGAGMLGATSLGGKALGAVGGKVLGKLGGEAEGEERNVVGSEAEGIENTAGTETAVTTEGEGNAVGEQARTADGNQDAQTELDPVDVVSGWMLTDATDVELPGVLPLVLRRAYTSGYATGRLFGPGWSSTLDQRLSINEAGIHFAGDDAQRLDYPVPADEFEVLPQRGRRWPLVWNRQTDEIRISDSWSGKTYHFSTVHYQDAAGQIRDLTAISDRNGNQIRIVRDASGTPQMVEHPGYRIAVDSSLTAAGPRITALRLLVDPAVSDSGSDVTLRRFDYDEHGRLVGVVDSSGLPLRYEWDEQSRIVAWEDRSGYRYAYHYDHLGRVVRGEGQFLSGTFSYDPSNRTTVATDSLGHETTYQYDEHGHVRTEIDPLGNTKLTETDRDGRILSHTDALGNQTTFEYGDAGNVRRVIAADGAVTSLGYSAPHQLVETTGPDGTTWQQEHDERGNLICLIGPTGAVTRFEYTPTGSLLTRTDALGATTRFTTDAAGLVIAETDPLGHTTRAVRDQVGRVVQVTDPLGAVTRFEWSAEGLPLSRTDPSGATVRWRHDANGRLLESVDPIGAITAFEPGPMGTLTARTGPDGVRHTFRYDSELNLLAVANPDSGTWSYAYDASGRLTEETDFVGRRLGYSYDAAGRIVERTTGAGQVITLVRDAVGRVVARQTPEGEYCYSYDSAGRMADASGPGGSVLAYEHDPLGRVLAETVGEHTTRYVYDAVGRRIRRVASSGAESEWTYDAAGRAIGLNAGTGRLDFVVDAAGRQTHRGFGTDSWLVRQYDAAGRPTGERLQRGNPYAENGLGASGLTEPDLILSRSWTWRPDGVPVELQDSVRGTRLIASDTSGRVTAISAQDWHESYAYDAYGNLATPVASGDPSAAGGPANAKRTLIHQFGRSHHEYDETGRLVRTVRRTLDGRRKTWAYTWDSQDQLVEATTPDYGTWRYSYDPIGRRTGKYRLGDDGTVAEQIRFTWDGMRVAERLTRGDDGVFVALTWDYDPGTFQPAAQRQRSWAADADQSRIDETFHAIVTDLIGTPTELVTPDGQIAWRTTTTLWGRTISTRADADVDCPLRFPGQYYDDETGLHYNLNRYYDPDTANYLTPDPLGLGPSPNDHSYVLNPLTFFDPLGLCETAEAPTPGLATLHYYPRIGEYGHFSIEVAEGAGTRHQDLWPHPGGPTEIRLLGNEGGLNLREPPDFSIPFELPNSEAAIKYMKDNLGVTKDYSLRDNNCLTFCTKTLSAGGLDVPTDFAAQRWARGLLGGGS